MALGNKADFAASDYVPEGSSTPRRIRPGKANNVSRSLQIISQQQGWDPTQIIDDVYQPARVGQSSTGPIPGSAADPAADHPGSDRAGWNKPDVGREKPKHTTGADPFPAMPGSR